MVFSLLIGMALAKGIAEGVHVAKGGMSYKGEEEFDKEVGYQGIDTTDIIRIAQRHGIYPNKKGILPHTVPPKRVIDYVKRYSNNPSDVEEFKSNWRKTVEEQFEARHEKVRTSSRDSKMYDKNLKDRKNNEVPYLSSSKTRIFVVEHWMGMPKGEHQRRVNEIVKNTILGDYLVGKPVLRENDWTLKTYAEYYKVKLNADSKKAMGDVEFNRLYRECCAKCGYDY